MSTVRSGSAAITACTNCLRRTGLITKNWMSSGICGKIALPGPDTSLVAFLGLCAYIVEERSARLDFIDKQYRGPKRRIFTMRYERDIDGVSSEQNAILLDSKGYLWIGARRRALRASICQTCASTPPPRKSG